MSLHPRRTPMFVKKRALRKSRMASGPRPPVRIIFAAVLKELMRQRGWTQLGAARASVNERTLGSWRNLPFHGDGAEEWRTMIQGSQNAHLRRKESPVTAETQPVRTKTKGRVGRPFTVP